MADPIEAHYTPDGDDWTVAVKGRGRTLTGRAPGLIAARDRADQLVEQLTPEESGRKTVVHMLNGDAVEFTTAYLTARLARTEEPPAVEEAEEPATADAEPDQDAPKDSPEEADEATPGPKATGDVPGPAASAEGPQVPAKPTPAPRAEPTTQPASAEETAPSSS
jgi:hypothetical protein